MKTTNTNKVCFMSYEDGTFDQAIYIYTYTYASIYIYTYTYDIYL